MKNSEDKKISFKRRSIIAGLPLAGAVVWHKPLVKSVLLPAHAQTSMSDTRNFFATVADAQEVSNGLGSLIINTLTQEAHAIANPNELPLSSLKFEAEAIDQGQGSYKVTVAAEDDPNTRSRAATPLPKVFVYGWEGVITNLNNPSNFTPTGCAATESFQAVAITTSSMTLEMTYFGKTVRLELNAGSASLPSFPLSCLLNE